MPNLYNNPWGGYTPQNNNQSNPADFLRYLNSAPQNIPNASVNPVGSFNPVQLPKKPLSFRDRLNPDNWTKEGIGSVGALLSGAGGLWGAYNGYKALGMAKDQMAFNERLSKGQFRNTADSLNNTIDQKNRYLGFSDTSNPDSLNPYNRLDRTF